MTRKSKISAIIGIIVGALTILTTLGTVAVWAADQRYVTVVSLDAAMIRADLRQAKKEKKELQLKSNPTEYEQKLIKAKQDEIQSLRFQLEQIK